MITILITGANGQVGRSLLKLGATVSHTLVGLTRSDLDITDAEAIAAAFHKHQPDLVINAAAYTAVDKAESDEQAAFAANATAPGLLAHACREAGIPLFHISTDYVFDGRLDRPYVESDPVNPVSVYGRSKAAGERAVSGALAQHLVLRTSWVFSEFGGNFLATMLRVGQERDTLKVVNDQWGGPTSARAIAAALLELAEQYRVKGALAWGTYHFSQSPHTTWHGFAEKIIDEATGKRLIDHPVEVLACPSTEYPTPVERPLNSQLNTSRFVQTFGFKPGDWDVDVARIVQP